MCAAITGQQTEPIGVCAHTRKYALTLFDVACTKKNSSSIAVFGEKRGIGRIDLISQASRMLRGARAVGGRGEGVGVCGGERKGGGR